MCVCVHDGMIGNKCTREKRNKKDKHSHEKAIKEFNKIYARHHHNESVHHTQRTSIQLDPH